MFWIITPPARSAADKLVIAGKPVTLEALRDSASTESELSGKPRLAARIARYTIGTLALLAAAGTLVGVLVGGFIGYQGISWMTDFSAQPWAYGMLASLFVGGVALVIFYIAGPYGLRGVFVDDKKTCRCGGFGDGACRYFGGDWRGYWQDPGFISS